MSGLAVDLFAGPGGWSEAARALGIPEIGLELDAAACATRAAAGHRTVRTDVSRFPADGIPGMRGLIGSPPCVVFSSAGKRAGVAVLDILADGIRDALAAEQDAGRWVLRTSFGKPAAGPKSTGTGSHGTHEMDPAERPAHAVTTKAKDWVMTRPATTLQCDQRLFGPHAGSKGESHSSNSVRITVQEAAILQSFRPDYPWQGTMTKQFQQAGNAVPPLLAEHVLAMATGISRMEAAA